MLTCLSKVLCVQCVCVCVRACQADEVTLCVSTRWLYRAESVKSSGCGNTRMSSASVWKETLLRRRERIFAHHCKVVFVWFLHWRDPTARRPVLSFPRAGFMDPRSVEGRDDVKGTRVCQISFRDSEPCHQRPINIHIREPQPESHNPAVTQLFKSQTEAESGPRQTANITRA